MYVRGVLTSAEATELWEKIKKEKSLADEAQEQYMQSLPQGISSSAVYRWSKGQQTPSVGEVGEVL